MILNYIPLKNNCKCNLQSYRTTSQTEQTLHLTIIFINRTKPTSQTEQNLHFKQVIHRTKTTSQTNLKSAKSLGITYLIVILFQKTNIYIKT